MIHYLHDPKHGSQCQAHVSHAGLVVQYQTELQVKSHVLLPEAWKLERKRRGGFSWGVTLRVQGQGWRGWGGKEGEKTKDCSISSELSLWPPSLSIFGSYWHFGRSQDCLCLPLLLSPFSSPFTPASSLLYPFYSRASMELAFWLLFPSLQGTTCDNPRSLPQSTCSE